MRFGEDFIEELKSRLKPSDVIGRSVKLRRQGREFAGLSPFNKEKTPSFFVNDEKGFYHCFSSGKHGDIITWVQETEGLSFSEAIERLAGQAGMALPAQDPQAEQKAAHRKGLIHWMEDAARFYAAELGRVRGRHARQYLQDRGLPEESWADFGLGFAPSSRTALKDHLVQNGADVDTLVEAGLVIKPDNGGAPYDRFRDRIMFPIHDARRRLIAFGGRALSAEARAKYLNSPETALFHKGDTLYHYASARTALHKNKLDGLIVVEGYMDVIALARAGLGHAVAPLGTALTEAQLQLLWQAGPNPVLCFDGDKAGQRAAQRAMERALPLLQPGRTLKFAFLPAGLDPDDMLRTRGRAAMEEVLRSARPLVDVLWHVERDAQALDTPESRAALKARLREVSMQIENKDVAAFYRQDLLGRAYALFNTRRHDQYGRKSSPRFPTPGLRAAVKNKAGGLAEQRFLVSQIIHNPALLEQVDETFANMKLGDDTLQRLRDAILEHWVAQQSVDRDSLHRHLTGQGFADDLRQLKMSTPLVQNSPQGQGYERWLSIAQELEDRAALPGEQAAREQQLAETIRKGDHDVLKASAGHRKGARPANEGGDT